MLPTWSFAEDNAIENLDSSSSPDTIVTAYARATGSGEDEVRQAFVELSQEEGIPYEQFVRSLTPDNLDGAKNGGGNNSLLPGSPGDIYYTRFGIANMKNIGHVGLYVRNNQVVEAAYNKQRDGVYQQSIRVPSWDIAGMNRLYINMGNPRQCWTAPINDALARADIWQRNKRPYNFKFWDNKHVDGTSYLNRRYSFNCSQLVWSAFINYLDLDRDPGNPAVKTDRRIMPQEIVHNRRTTSY